MISDVDNFTNETFSPGQWDGVNHFARMVGWEFIFGLNSLLRYPDGVWDSNNAALLMSYSNSKNYNVQWELGNGIYKYELDCCVLLVTYPKF